MGQLMNIITPLHTRSKREYLARMVNDKVHCSEVARKFEADFWDGERKYGYGGYKYDGRWVAVAQALIDQYRLSPHARILDVGCGKGFLLHELKKLLPGAAVVGIDISDHALRGAKEEVKPFLSKQRAQDPYPFKDKEFDLVFSNTTLHNLPVQELDPALREIQRVGKRSYICVESFRTVQELFNVQCWALTCETFLRPEGWQWLFQEAGYTGDYEFIYFE